eukprot:Skav230228  [mRNA]  locus=scaffold4204:22091:25412:+ [translate_table: standard]
MSYRFHQNLTRLVLCYCPRLNAAAQGAGRVDVCGSCEVIFQSLHQLFLLSPQLHLPPIRDAVTVKHVIARELPRPIPDLHGLHADRASLFGCENYFW